jgi:hypothetical protein
MFFARERHAAVRSTELSSEQRRFRVGPSHRNPTYCADPAWDAMWSSRRDHSLRHGVSAGGLSRITPTAQYLAS